MAWQHVRTPEEEERRQFELDIDLKIIRAAKRGLPMTYDIYQKIRYQVLGRALNIKCQPRSDIGKFPEVISR